MNDDGQYGGAVARWIERDLGPALGWTPAGDIDAQLVHSLCGQADIAAGPARVSWEGRAYLVDLVAPEERRLIRVREKIGEHNELHIVQGAKEDSPHDINIHLAFTVPSVEEFAKHLDAMNVKYGNWNQTSKENSSWRRTGRRQQRCGGDLTHAEPTF